MSTDEQDGTTVPSANKPIDPFTTSDVRHIEEDARLTAVYYAALRSQNWSIGEKAAAIITAAWVRARWGKR